MESGQSMTTPMTGCPAREDIVSFNATSNGLVDEAKVIAGRLNPQSLVSMHTQYHRMSLRLMEWQREMSTTPA